MKQTSNYNLNLYEPNDLANLTDGYNDSMQKIDTDMKAVEEFVQSYDAMIEQNAADIVTEKNRATAAEKANADAISAETTRAEKAEEGLKQVGDNLQTSINSEYTRALNAETALQEAIATETKRAQTTENELATGVSNATKAVTTEKDRAEAAESSLSTDITALHSVIDGKFPVGTANIEDGSITSTKLAASAVNALLENITIRHFDSTDSSADNTGLVCPSYLEVSGFFIENLNILIINNVNKTSNSSSWDNKSTNLSLPSYVPKTKEIQLTSCGLIEYTSSSNYSTWTGLRLGNGYLYPNSLVTSANGGSLPGNIVICLTPFVSGSNATSYASYAFDNGVI